MECHKNSKTFHHVEHRPIVFDFSGLTNYQKQNISIGFYLELHFTIE